MSNISSQHGFSLVETLIALGVLTVGVLGTAAAVLATGVQH
jgi:prepilin-type N-terminal cleavage/methylation domain-containing protein